MAFDEVLQGYEDTFSEVSGEATLYSYQKNPATGIAGGIDLPPAWRTLEPGAAVRLRLLVPPGVDYGTIYIQAWSMDAYIGTCDGLTADCPLAQANGSPPFWPRPPDGAASPASTPAIVSLVVRAALDPFTFSSLAITWHVADAALYRAWRADRPWAGGAGDCDGLGGAYCR